MGQCVTAITHPQPKKKSMMLDIPPGTLPGSMFKFTTPEGDALEIMIPEFHDDSEKIIEVLY